VVAGELFPLKDEHFVTVFCENRSGASTSRPSADDENVVMAIHGRKMADSN
jgi:hypothetical protein